jgi:hypothetical protein
MCPPLAERVARFPEFLAAGLPDPWPSVAIGGFVALAAAGTAIGGAYPRGRALVAFGFALAGQIAMYLALPLNTNTATYVSARHALLVVLFVVPLLPVLGDAWRGVARAVLAMASVVSLAICGQHIACFDREARDFDDVLAAMEPRRRVLPLVYARGSACTHRATFPYLHFAAYYMAARGGELARTFATVWNVPIRYRSDYPRYPIREQLEWAPQQVSATDIAHFDYVLVRGPRAPRWPAGVTLREVASSGAWTVFENADALPAELPSK